MNFRSKTVLALTALAVLGGTTSAFAAATEGLNGAKVTATTPSSDRTEGIQARLGAKRFAVVEANGVLVRGRNAWSANQVAGGTYEVFFDRDIRGCSYDATIGTTSIGTEPAGSITVASRAGSPNGVWVDTSNLNGTDGTRAFHLEVNC